MKYSIVVPVYNSSKTLDELYNRIKNVFENTINQEFELILVNDASKDGSFDVAKRLSHMDNRVKYIDFAKNHGQQRAVLCGIEHCDGDFVITMDDDLQHPPEEIPKLIEKMASDPKIDVVIGMYDSKKHNCIRKIGTVMLNALSNMVFKKDKDLKLTSFRLMKSFVADNLSQIDIKAPTVGHCLLMIDGYIVNTTIRHDPRKSGKSGYSFRKLVSTFMDNVYANSDFPLRVLGDIGTLTFIVSILMSFYFFIRYITGHIHVSGWTTLVILVLFMNGLCLFAIGILGRYMIFSINETKRLPKYAIREKNVDSIRSSK